RSVVVLARAGLAEGWAGLPAPIRQGVVLLAAHLFEQRDASVAPPSAITALWRPFRRIALCPTAHAC
ncbi:head-tail connector protein, partial [Acinetobacter baumannii]